MTDPAGGDHQFRGMPAEAAEELAAAQQEGRHRPSAFAIAA